MSILLPFFLIFHVFDTLNAIRAYRAYITMKKAPFLRVFAVAHGVQVSMEVVPGVIRPNMSNPGPRRLLHGDTAIMVWSEGNPEHLLCVPEGSYQNFDAI